MIRKNILFALTIIFVLLNFTGCTIFGFVAGARSDAKKAIVQPPTLAKLQTIKQDTPLKLQLQDGPIIAGKFQGIEQVEPAEYARRYEIFYSHPLYRQYFPGMNNTIIIARNSDLRTTVSYTKYLFSGFDLNFILLRTSGDSAMKSEHLDSLLYIADTTGQKMNPHTFKLYMDKGIVPLHSEMVVQSSAGRERIPLEKVRQMELPKPVSGRIFGALIGFSIDAIIVYECIQSMRSSFASGLNLAM
jgi:hypothetical protein